MIYSSYTHIKTMKTTRVTLQRCTSRTYERLVVKDDIKRYGAMHVFMGWLLLSSANGGGLFSRMSPMLVDSIRARYIFSCCFIVSDLQSFGNAQMMVSSTTLSKKLAQAHHAWIRLASKMLDPHMFSDLILTYARILCCCRLQFPSSKQLPPAHLSRESSWV
jgi:hypothetical protein